MQKNWTDEELTAAVIAYKQMKQGHHKEAVSKRDVYRRLAAQFGRTENAFEYRMQNISSVLVGMGYGTVPGLLPATNVGANVLSDS
jgi:5-methylcytosine-specific restriction protein A